MACTSGGYLSVGHRMRHDVGATVAPIVAAGVAFLAACDSAVGPVAPSTPPNSTYLTSRPPTPPTNFAVRCEPLSASLSYMYCRAFTGLGNAGPFYDLASLSEWTSSNEMSFTVEAGLVRAVAPGRGIVVAKYTHSPHMPALIAEQAIIVPPGEVPLPLQRLTVSVQERQANVPPLFLESVRVEILDGSEAGRFCLTAPGGACDLPDVPARTYRFRVSRDRYVTLEADRQVPYWMGGRNPPPSRAVLFFELARQ